MCTWIAGEISRHKAKSCLLYKYTSIHRFHISFDENQDFVKPHSNTLTVTKYGLQVQINSFFFFYIPRLCYSFQLISLGFG